MGRTMDFQEAIDQIRNDKRASAPKQIYARVDPHLPDA